VKTAAAAHLSPFSHSLSLSLSFVLCDGQWVRGVTARRALWSTHSFAASASSVAVVVVVVISPNRYCERPLFTGHNLHDKQLARSSCRTPGGFLYTRVSADDVLPSARG